VVLSRDYSATRAHAAAKTPFEFESWFLDANKIVAMQNDLFGTARGEILNLD
jgi:hypothetical protein